MDDLMLVYVISCASGWIVMAFACAWLAGQRGRDKVTWGCLGLLLGLLALILLAVAPAKK